MYYWLPYDFIRALIFSVFSESQLHPSPPQKNKLDCKGPIYFWNPMQFRLLNTMVTPKRPKFFLKSPCTLLRLTPVQHHIYNVMAIFVRKWVLGTLSSTWLTYALCKVNFAYIILERLFRSKTDVWKRTSENCFQYTEISRKNEFKERENFIKWFPNFSSLSSTFLLKSKNFVFN